METRTKRTHDVDIFNVIQKVQDTVIHLEVDEEQWKITQGSKRQAKWVWSPRTMSGLRLPDILLMLNTNTTIHALRPETKGVSVVDSHIQRIVLATEKTTVTSQPRTYQMSIPLVVTKRYSKVNGSHHGDNPLL